MSEPISEKRTSERYDTQVKVYFSLAYDLETKVNYQLIDKDKNISSAAKEQAVSKNVSIEGLCIVSSKKLNKHDKLAMEVYVPSSDEPILMKGDVRWCQEAVNSKGAKEYLTGILVETVNGQLVKDTINYDDQYMIKWSAVLESVLGSYRILSQERAKDK